MATFRKALEKVLPNEGFYSNVKGDLGAETYMGISRRANPKWAGWDIIDQFKEEHGGRIRHNARIQSEVLDKLVEELYYEKYWKKVKGDQIENEGIAANLFDMYVNAPGSAIRLMQQSLKNMGCDIIVDGIIGPQTIKLINSVNEVDLNEAFNMARQNHYINQSLKGQNFKFLQGWLNRVKHFERIV